MMNFNRPEVDILVNFKFQPVPNFQYWISHKPLRGFRPDSLGCFTSTPSIVRAPQTEKLSVKFEIRAVQKMMNFTKT